MEVLLREDVERLGSRGDVVNVAPGYARNYLMPRGLATKATEASKSTLELQRRREERRKQQELQDLLDLGKKLEGTSCTVAAQASPEGHLFGSVGPEQIARAFKADGLAVEPGMVRLSSPIKETGVFAVTLQVNPQSRVSTKVWVVPE